jgi:hypothetical protein
LLEFCYLLLLGFFPLEHPNEDNDLEDNGFVHRNLSAKNVMFKSADNCVKITDADNCVMITDAAIESNQCDPELLLQVDVPRDPPTRNHDVAIATTVPSLNTASTFIL